MIGRQSVQRRCDKCSKAVLHNNKSFCQLYCTMKRDYVSKFDQCDKFFLGKFSKGWVK